jgi:arylsulfatase A-like enzyme
VPYLVQWQGTLPAGKVYDRPVSTLDIVPTALAAAAAAAPPDTKLDGVNLLPFFKDEATGDPHARLYWRYLRRGMWSIRAGDWKLVKMKGKREVPMLYDLSKDLAEATDLAAQHPDKVKAMQTAYETWAKHLPEPLWMNTKDNDN